jgi:hypothetical protein
VPSKYRHCYSSETSCSLGFSNNAFRQKCVRLLLIASAATSVDDFLDHLFAGSPVQSSDRRQALPETTVSFNASASGRKA